LLKLEQGEEKMLGSVLCWKEKEFVSLNGDGGRREGGREREKVGFFFFPPLKKKFSWFWGPVEY